MTNLLGQPAGYSVLALSVSAFFRSGMMGQIYFRAIRVGPSVSGFIDIPNYIYIVKIKVINEILQYNLIGVNTPITPRRQNLDT